MSERQYFALRYAIPGYTFILLLIVINAVPLLKILEMGGVSDVFGAFLAFFSLFSGSAIGFLISQGWWWWWWQNHYGILEVDEYKESIDAFCSKYGLEKPECDSVAKRKFISALDYVGHSKVDKNLLILAERRWDMYHILSSTLLALCVAVVAGIACRGYYQISFSFQSTAEAQTEAVALIFTAISVLFLLIFLCMGRKWILAMSASLHEARIRSSDVEPEDLKKAFKSLYDKYACKHDRYGRKTARALPKENSEKP